MLNSYTSVVILCGDQHVVEKGENNQEPKYFHCIYWDRAIQHKQKMALVMQQTLVIPAILLMSIFIRPEELEVFQLTSVTNTALQCILEVYIVFIPVFLPSPSPLLLKVVSSC